MASPIFVENRKPQAVVVLGCRLREGVPGPALARRLEEALKIYDQDLDLPIVMSGGRKWDGRSESSAMSVWWRQRRGSRDCLLEEAESLTTGQNAHYAARLLHARDWRQIVLVTCDFHMARATQLFEAKGVQVTARPARYQRGWFQNAKLVLREWGARKLLPWEPPVR